MSLLNHAILSTETMSLILKKIDDAPTLYSLLTVNKATFALAVKQLYSRVFNMPDLSESAIDGYIRFVLSLSPVNSKALEMLREYFSVEWPRKDKPYIDYLSLLTDARFNRFEEVQQWKRGPKALCNLDSRLAVLWAVCGHRLSEITALEAEGSELKLEPFLLDAHLPKYMALKRIEFRVSGPKDLTAVRDFLKHFIQINPRAKQLEVVLLGVTFDKYTVMKNIAKLLDPPVSPRKISGHNLVACHTHQNDVDFSQVKVVSIPPYLSVSMKEESLIRDLLPKCSSLEWFRGNIQDPRVHMFGWAVSKRAPTVKVPPLRRVEFYGESLPAMVAIDDALHGFAPTLEVLYANIIDNMDFAKDHFSMKRIGARCSLPRLRILRVENQVPNVSITLDPKAVPNMPSLEMLSLYNPPDAPDEGMQYSDHLHKMYPITMWPVLQFPKLVDLTLGGRSLAEFNPESLRHLPSLRVLSLALLSDDWSRYWHANLWTWNWYLPHLVTLVLEQGAIAPFTLSALRYLPALEVLELRECSAFPIPSYQDLVAQLGSEGEDLGKKVRKVVLTGSSLDVSKQDWIRLLNGDGWFPNLEELTVSTCTVHDIEIVQRARRHPHLAKFALETTSFSNKGGTKDLIEKGWESINVADLRKVVKDNENDDVDAEWDNVAAIQGRLLCRLDYKDYSLPKDL